MSTGVSGLSERQQQIFDLIQSDPTMTLRAIADRAGISHERVRQIAVKLKEMGLIGDRKELRLEAIRAERRARVLTKERRKRIWRRMMFVAHRIRLRSLAHIDHRGMVRDYHMPGEEAVCQFEGCTRPVRVRGFCSLHYMHLRKTGALWVRRHSRYICKEDGCDVPVYARNMCHTHYGVWQRKHRGESVLPAHNTSGYRGVTAEKGTDRWLAYIRRPGEKQEYLGAFDSKETAARAYDTAARKYLGTRAKLNFPNENIEVVKEKRQPRGGRPSASGYRGVQWYKRTARWEVRITRGGKHIYVGRFLDLEAAARAYDSAARYYCGPEAELNFPDEEPAPYVSPAEQPKERSRGTPSRLKAPARRKETSSKYHGVSWDKARSKWVASLWIEGKNKKLGRFSDEVEAARAYDRAVMQLGGDKTKLNFLCEESKN